MSDRVQTDALECGGIFATRMDGMTATKSGFPVACVRLTMIGLDENQLATTIIAHLTRQETADLAENLRGMLCDG